MSPEIVLFVSTYGYIAVFFGSLIEGEVLLVIASFLAYVGQLELPLVILAAFFGTLLSDWIWFLLGRHSNDAFLQRWHWLHKLSTHSVTLVGKRPRLTAFLIRFMYGLRVIVPFSLGKTTMSGSTFLLYNALGVLLWVGIFSFLGYFFAGAMETIFGRVRHLELIVLAIIIGAIIIFRYINKIIRPQIERYFNT